MKKIIFLILAIGLTSSISFAASSNDVLNSIPGAKANSTHPKAARGACGCKKMARAHHKHVMHTVTKKSSHKATQAS